MKNIGYCMKNKPMKEQTLISFGYMELIFSTKNMNIDVLKSNLKVELTTKIYGKPVKAGHISQKG